MEEEIRDVMTAEGVGPATIDKLVEELRIKCEISASKTIAKKFFGGLPITPGAEAIMRFFLDDKEPLREAARRIGCSPSSLLRAQRRLIRFLGFRVCATPHDKNEGEKPKTQGTE